MCCNMCRLSILLLMSYRCGSCSYCGCSADKTPTEAVTHEYFRGRENGKWVDVDMVIDLKEVCPSNPPSLPSADKLETSSGPSLSS